VEREGAPSGRGGQPSVGRWLPPLPLSQIMTCVERGECEGAPPLKRLAAPYGSAPPLKRGAPLPWHMLKIKQIYAHFIALTFDPHPLAAT
jgi:hypothetical protein